jgi:hypothetical protein
VLYYEIVRQQKKGKKMKIFLYLLTVLCAAQISAGPATDTCGIMGTDGADGENGEGTHAMLGANGAGTWKGYATPNNA